MNQESTLLLVFGSDSFPFEPVELTVTDPLSRHRTPPRRRGAPRRWLRRVGACETGAGGGNSVILKAKHDKNRSENSKLKLILIFYTSALTSAQWWMMMLR